MLVTRFNYKKYKDALISIFVNAFLSINEYYDPDQLGEIMVDFKEGNKVKEHYKYIFKYEINRLYRLDNMKVYNKYFIFNRLKDNFVNKIYEMKNE